VLARICKLHFPYAAGPMVDKSPTVLVETSCSFLQRKKSTPGANAMVMPTGSILDIKDWELVSRERWFGDMLPRTGDARRRIRAARIFDELGLDRSFWNIPGSFFADLSNCDF